jgi:hypothetical protein
MSNENSGDPYAPALAHLEAQRAQIDAAIATLKALQSGMQIPVASGPLPQTANNPPGLRIEIDTFHALTVAQAIKKFLAMRPRKPATTQEIVDALRGGGQSGADGTNFAVVVNNSLNRMARADGEISKVRRGVWGLKTWYEKAKAPE